MNATTPSRSPDLSASATSRWWLLAALAIVVLVFALRVPGVVQPIGPDQGVYATIGWGLGQGLTLYRDLWEQKPPGIYLTYWLAFAVLGTKVSTIFWLEYLAAALTVGFVFDTGRRLLSARFGAIAAAVLAVGAMPAARFDYGGFLERSVTETFISALAAAAAWATVVAVTRGRARWMFAAGFLVGLAFVFKQTALIYWPAFLLWAWLVSDARTARRLALLSVPGLAIVPTAALIWLLAQGVLGDAWGAFVEYNVAYLAIGDQGIAGTALRFAQEVWRRVRGDEVWALGALSACIAVLSWRWRSTPAGRVGLLGVVWLGAALVAVAANGPRLFTTYFVPSLVPLCLLFAWLLHQTIGAPARSRRVAGVVLLALAGVLAVRAGSVRRAMNSTSWDARHLFGQIGREAYLDRFRSRSTQAFSAAENERLAAYVQAHTTPDEKIFVFGMTAGTYFMSGRLPASRFLFAYPAVSNMGGRPEFRVETLAAELARTKARYIILQRHNGDSFSGWRAAEAFEAPPLAALVASAYRLETEIGDFVLYRRIDSLP